MNCFSCCRSLSSVIFESRSRLSRIKWQLTFLDYIWIQFKIVTN
jgi:hypothetical protein